MRHLVTLVLIAWAAPAFANARGTSVYQAHCARCHVVGQGAPLRDKPKTFIDITLAAKQHDQKWLLQFMQKPTSVAPNTACRTKLNETDANDVYRFLKKALKAPPPADPNAKAGPPNATRLSTGKLATETEWRAAAPLKTPKPTGMVHR
jgi:mono/diheme cytochrome c family protein